MAITILARREPFRGLRRFDPSRDLRQVTELICAAFGANLDAEGRAALADMQRLSALGPLVRFILTADPNLRRLLNGYVWIEEGRVVGNMSLQSSLQYGGRWYVSNVAVAPDFRGRGVARSLMKAALDQVRQRGGGWMLLQAAEGNTAAMKLYSRLGFTALGGTAHLYLPRPETARPSASGPPKGRPSPRHPSAISLPRCRLWRPADWHSEYELAKAATPSLLQWWLPLRSADFRLEIEDRLGEWFDQLIGRRQTFRWVVLREGSVSEQLVASLRVRAARRQGEHQLRLLVHPDQRGALEEPLVQQAMGVLASYPKRSVTARHPSEHSEAIQAFLAHGFQVRRNLISMRKRI